MIDDIIQELWNAKDDIANEHNCNFDRLLEFYLKKQDDVYRQKHSSEERASKQPFVQPSK